VFGHLQIADPWERRLVAAADAALSILTAPGRLLGARTTPMPPQRILLLRLERIGDFLMTLPALAAVRRLAPHATIDLAVGSWNAPLARLVPGVSRVLTADAPWLTRGGEGATAMTLARRARQWPQGGYDLAINFEGDIRSHALMALTGARRRVGFDHGGGGPLLTDRVAFDPRRHTSVNAVGLVAKAFLRDADELTRESMAGPDHFGPRLALDEATRQAAARLLDRRRPPLVGIHASGGREVKQWPTERFAGVAARLLNESGATVVLTGSAADRAMVDSVSARLPAERVLDVAGKLDLPGLAGVLERLAVLVTGDTGPMHLAEAVGTPVVAIFGPSDPRRYGPRLPSSLTVRVDLPCSPCNRIRRPPERCVGHTPDCLERVDVDAVADAAREIVSLGQLSRTLDASSSD
jgi:lipopolysaccharide heptosyltransferase II